MDLEILLIVITLIVCSFFIAIVRLLLRCAEEAEVMDYIGMAQVVDSKENKEDYEPV